MLAGNPTESLVLSSVNIFWPTLEAATLGGYKRLRTLVFARPKDAGPFERCRWVTPVAGLFCSISSRMTPKVKPPKIGQQSGKIILCVRKN